MKTIVLSAIFGLLVSCGGYIKPEAVQQGKEYCEKYESTLDEMHFWLDCKVICTDRNLRHKYISCFGGVDENDNN